MTQFQTCTFTGWGVFKKTSAAFHVVWRINEARKYTAMAFASHCLQVHKGSRRLRRKDAISYQFPRFRVILGGIDQHSLYLLLRELEGGTGGMTGCDWSPALELTNWRDVLGTRFVHRSNYSQGRRKKSL